MADKAPLSTRARRTQDRARTRRVAAKEERLKAKVESWIGSPLRQAMRKNEQFVNDVTEQLDGKGSIMMVECKRLQERIVALESNMENLVKERVTAVLSIYRNDMEATRLNIERGLREQGQEMKRNIDTLRSVLDKQKKDYQAESETTMKRVDGVERSILESKTTQDTLQMLKTEFATYVSHENQREEYTRRLEILVKDMESRNWPWRPNMDRSVSPPPLGDDFVKVTPGNPDPSEWRPWPSHRPVKTPPSSRPSSARYRRPSPSSSDVTFSSGYKPLAKSPSISSAGSGLAAARIRPSSARQHR